MMEILETLRGIKSSKLTAVPLVLSPVNWPAGTMKP
jgi:hypothetical protein